MLSEKHRKVEIKKIVTMCEENYIECNINKLDFIEKDTRETVILDVYTLLVVKEEGVYKLDGFYSINKVYSYLEKTKANQGNTIYEDNKEIIGYIIVNNTKNTRDFCDLCLLYKEELKGPPNKKQKLEEPDTSTINASNTTSSLYTQIYQLETNLIHILNNKKYMLFTYLKEHKYLIDCNINGKTIMCLYTKNQRLIDVVENIGNIEISKVSVSKYINMFGLIWGNVRSYCCIPVNMATFEEYYFPFTKGLYKNNKEKIFQYLTELFSIYQTPSSKNEEEVQNFKKKVYEICKYNQYLSNYLLEKHTTYSRANS